MLKLIRRLLADNALYIAVIITITILVLSLIPVSDVLMSGVKNSDKFYHIFFYTLLSLSWLFYYKPFKKIKVKAAISVGLLIYGIIIEVLQSTLTTYRTGDFYDVVADAVGIVIALILFENLYKLIFQNI